MTIIKSLGNTVLFILILNVISCWILFEFSIEIDTLLCLNDFFTPFFSLLIVSIYLGLLKDSKFLTISKTPFKYYLWGLLLGAAFVFIQSPLNIFYNELFDTHYNPVYRFEPLQVLKWSNFSGVIIVPVYEEFFFRKFIQRDFQKSFHPILAILFTSLLFASIHLPFHFLFYEDLLFNFHHAYITFFGGLILGSLFYKSNSIGPSIAMHCSWNFCVYLF